MRSESGPGAGRDGQGRYAILKSYSTAHRSPSAGSATPVLLPGHQLLALQLQLLYFHVAKPHKSLSFSHTEEMKTPCIEADLVPALVPLLESTDQELLLHAGRAIGRICYGNRKYRLAKSLYSLAVRHRFVRHLNFMRPECSMHFSLHLHRHFRKLTGARLNMSQGPPDLWILDCKVSHLCQTAHAIALIYFYRGWIPQVKAGSGGLAKLCPEPAFPTHVR